MDKKYNPKVLVLQNNFTNFNINLKVGLKISFFRIK